MSSTPAASLPPVSLIPVANLPPVAHLDLRISPQIFEKIQNGPNGILWARGKLIHEKTRSKKSCDTVPLKRCNNTSFTPKKISLKNSMWVSKNSENVRIILNPVKPVGNIPYIGCAN
jgi:hypothetical protein